MTKMLTNYIHISAQTAFIGLVSTAEIKNIILISTQYDAIASLMGNDSFLINTKDFCNFNDTGV